MNNAVNINTHQNNDEVDLFELLITLWKNKWTIAGITAICTLIAIIIAIVITPQYQVKTVLKPVNNEQLFELNNSGIYSTTPDQLFDEIRKQIFSYQIREDYLLNNKDLLAPIFNDQTNYEQMIANLDYKNLKIIEPKKDDTQKYIAIEFTYPKEVDGVAILNGFVNTTITDFNKQIPQILSSRIQQKQTELSDQLVVLRAGYNASINADIEALQERDQLQKLLLEDELQGLRIELKAKRLNRIEQLNEAIEIAKTLGYNKPTSPSSESSIKTNNVVRTEIIQQSMPLYFMGTEALTAERDQLLKRDNDDFTNPRIAEIERELYLLKNNRKIEMYKLREQHDMFLSEIATIEKESARLKTINPNISNFEVVSIDEKAQTPLSPIKPNKKLIVIIGFLLGSILSILIVLIRQAIRNRYPKTK